MNDRYRSEASVNRLIQQWASLIHRSKLAGLAVLMLEMIKPVGFVAGQVLWVVDPILRSLVGRSSRNYALLLEDPRSIERLLATLEERPIEPPM